MASRRIAERVQFEAGVAPIDITGAGADGDWVSMAHGRRLGILILTGTWAGGTSAVTLQQATSNAGAGAKALTPTEYFIKTGNGAASPWVRTAIVAGTFNLSAAQKVILIEVDATELDVNGGFTHVRARVATPGANADLVAIAYVWIDLREDGEPENHADPKS